MDAELTLQATRGSVAIKDFLIYRSIDSEPFTLLATKEVEVVDLNLYSAAYTDFDVVFVTDVRYYTVARDMLMNLSPDSNILTLLPPANSPNYILTTTDGSPWQKSIDGITWEALAVTHVATKIRWIVSSDTLTQRWIAVGNGIWYSDDGDTWIAATAPSFTNGTDFDFSADQDIAVAVSSNDVIFYSTDFGVTWQEAPAYTNQNFQAVKYDAFFGLWNVLANSGNPSTQRVQSSPDALNWTLRSISSNLGGMALASDAATKFLAVGALSNVFGNQRSLDGVSWASAGNTPFGSATSADFGLGLFMLNGFDGVSDTVVQTSASGTGSWSTAVVDTSAASGTIVDLACDPTRNKWWLSGRNRLYRSTDAAGTIWELALETGNLFQHSIGVKPAAP